MSGTNRRHFLRGVGACLALPAMESLLSNPLMAASAGSSSPIATTATGAPLRTAFLSFPNGAIPKAWWPDSTGNDYEFSPTLKPLQNMRDSIQLVKGLDMEVAEGKQDGGGDHARGNGTFLTGVRIKKSATDIRAGVSIDQVIANEVGQLTRFPSLELASDPIRQVSGCDSGYSCAYQYNISWKTESTPMATENNPRLVFERLFGAGKRGERAKSLQQRREDQRSILDFVLEDTRRMSQRLQSTDKRKLDEYLSGVRALERRIEKAESFGDPKDPDVDTPIGVPQSHQEYVAVMYDLLVLAFQTDSTRVASLMLGHDGDNRSYDFIGITEGHHSLSHHQNKEERIAKVQRIDRWYVEQFSKFLKKLESTKDVDGNSILHNSMIVFGSGNADGNNHTHTDLPLVLAGHGGGKLTAGRFVDHGGKPLTNLYVSLGQQMGLDSLSEFGDSNGIITNL